MPATMTLEAPAPEWLAARIDAAEARRVVKGRQGALEMMESENRLHADEVAQKSRTGNRLITNGTAARQGGGFGAEVIYRRCQCSGFPPSECHHDPTESPYSAEIIEAGRAAIVKAEKALKVAEKRLAGVDTSFDVFANARENGARYVWWPLDRNRDPRKYRHRGQPLTDADVQALGPHRLRQAVNSGGVVEVT